MRKPRSVQRSTRVSDADREAVVERLRVAGGHGRLDLQEMEKRQERAFAAGTYAELDPLVTDLPPDSPTEPAARGHTVEMQQTGMSITRRGRWQVPRRLVVEGRFATTLLDFSEAVIAHPEVEIVLAMDWAATRIIVPKGAAVDTGRLAMDWGSLTNNAASCPQRGGVWFRITGSHQRGSVTIRYPRRFSRWVTARGR